MKQHVIVESFSYKHGVPPAGASVIDCRRMRNPHFIPSLKPLDGRTDAVREYVKTDPACKPMIDDVVHRVMLARDGGALPTIAFGCYGGKHRSVAMAELAARSLRDAGCAVDVEHSALS
jgi:RNase adapter protein RapZ